MCAKAAKRALLECGKLRIMNGWVGFFWDCPGWMDGWMDAGAATNKVTQLLRGWVVESRYLTSRLGPHDVDEWV